MRYGPKEKGAGGPDGDDPRRSGVPDEEDDFLGTGSTGTEAGSRQPERVGVAFNLSKQLSTELDRIRHELEEDTHPSKSEIAEVALRIAVEDVRSRGRESELVKRLEERHAARAADATWWSQDGA